MGCEDSTSDRHEKKGKGGQGKEKAKAKRNGMEWAVDWTPPGGYAAV